MPTVLIVDDNAVDRRFAGGLIEESGGVDVIYADDGEQALEKIHELKPDVVVTDLQMPHMDGLELVTKIRLTNPAIPVVLMTAKGSEVVAVQALQQGASSLRAQIAARQDTTPHSRRTVLDDTNRSNTRSANGMSKSHRT